jgi:hypothetical protein
MKQEQAAVARQQCGRHISTVTNQDITKEELLGVVSSVQSTPKLYNEDQREKLVSRRQESPVSSYL